MTVRTFRGHWWLPDDEENTQPGILTVGANGDLLLDLIGGFNLEIRIPNGNGFDITGAERPVPVMLGYAEGGKITLLNCSTRRAENLDPWTGNPMFHKLRAGRALVGIHLTEPDDAVFRQAEIRLENLFSFLSQASLQHDFASKDGKQTAFMQEPAPFSVTVDGVELSAGQRAGRFHFEQSRDSSAVVGRAQAILTITPPQSVGHIGFEELIKSFMDLLTLASNQPCGVISCVLTHEKPQIFDNGPDDVFERPVRVEVINERTYTPQPETQAQEGHKWLFSCGVKPYEDIVAAWMPLHELARPACSMLFSLKYTAIRPLDAQALMVAVSAEAMHKSLYANVVGPPHPEARAEATELLKNAGSAAQKRDIKKRLEEPSYRNRLLYLATVPPRPVVDLIIPSALTWAAQMVDIRNGLAHEADHAKDVWDVYDLTMSTTFLLYLVLMTRLRFDESELRAAIQNKLWKS